MPSNEAALTRSVPAKINLGLHVLRPRPGDGNHDIETVLVRIGWADRLSGRPARELLLTCSDPALPTDEDNLCVAAARRLAEAFDVERGAALHLEKRVPYGAGLGGGSSDAAATLRLLAELWDLDAPPERLRALAAEIGADVPFFLQDAPAALATGRGTHLQPLRFPAEASAPYRLPFSLVVVVPEAHVSTAEAYRRVEPRATGRPDLAALVCSNDLARWRDELTNDFAPVAFEAHSEIEAARDLLTDAGAGYASLTGSGSAVFGLFEDAGAAEAATEAARRSGHRVHREPPAG
ncbi:MAG: 4-(cytidine 5'-diphospho)-2-C-methyl-D-erythritol kinase [Bacteroidetes bacterium QS_8_68_15]|nr:MAG: 4-(cytidine 5'-diphospho)-2-C-methyl-D-erythritol kinase [Bacteroidetes bacterium QS_8_68_15]